MNEVDVAAAQKSPHAKPTSTSIEEAADIAKTWDVLHRPSTPSMFFSRVRAVREALKKLESDIARKRNTVLEGAESTEHRAALLGLGTNYRVMRSTITALTDSRKSVNKLPRIVLGEGGEEPRIAAIAGSYLQAVDGEFSAESLCRFLRVVQSYEALNVNELWSTSAFLKFTLLELILEEANALLSAGDQSTTLALLKHLKSLTSVANTDWVVLIEPLIVLDSILCQDPAKKYREMDFESRDLFRRRIGFIANFSDCTESEVAQMALELAREEQTVPITNSRVQSRRIHIGYYLIDRGFAQLASRVGFHPSLGYRLRRFARAHGEDVYLTSIAALTLLLMAGAIFPVIPVLQTFIGLALGILALLLPASQNAVEFVNAAICAAFEPEPLPKLDFSKGVPVDCTTLVVVPTLLLNEHQVRGLVNDLEVRFFANRDPHVHFALLTDIPDSVTKPRTKDSHPLVDLAISLIEALNAKHRDEESGSFVLLHRRRVFNRRQGVWMGWERKRGKLLDLNSYLFGEGDAFPIKAGNTQVLRHVRFVLTLDSDTQLPHGAAARLAGAMSHPLNQAVIDPISRIVTEGYGILQPRIGITVRATTRSRLAAIYSGQVGLDIYSRTTSDAYQDLFREGIFTGKGIYEVETLHAVLKGRFPRNTLLSHDLLEGAYARAGLAADIELFDDYPSHYSAYSRRKHRWVRGDWQIAQWIFSQVPNEAGVLAPNPISDISRWKILDNLRRSLVQPFFLMLFVAGWLRLEGGPTYWTIVALFLLIFPALLQLGFRLGIAVRKQQLGGVREALAGFGRSAFVTFIDLVLLAHQFLLALDAIVRSGTRWFITGESLLEWETAAQVELTSSSRSPVDWYLLSTPLLSLGIGLLIWVKFPTSAILISALPILALWALAFPVTVWLDAPPRRRHPLDRADDEFLMSQALLIWRYFKQFGTERHNYLIPDNVQEENLCDAPRVSPTNLGLLLNARQAAFEFGFLTLPELADLTSRSLATIELLEKFRGHLYNWYDTHTLAPLKGSPFVSSVDSGNFVASLYTLHVGARHASGKPLLCPALLSSLRLYWRLIPPDGNQDTDVARFPLPEAAATMDAWIEWLSAGHAMLAKATAPRSEHDCGDWWMAETRERVAAILALVQNYIPWVLPEFRSLRSIPQLEFDDKSSGFCLRDAAVFAEAFALRLVRNWDVIAADPSLFVIGQKLRACLHEAINNLRQLEMQLQSIVQESAKLAEATEFSFLVHPCRQVLSIGYDVDTHQLHDACYDMIASEARIATLLAIARGDLPPQSWSRLSRDHAHAYGRFLLLSWTGTMFEYLMPALWMRSYPGTLIARSQEGCVCVQRAFARALRIPWGISESSASRKNSSGDYHYQAYGIPRIALSFEVTAGPVVSPYSTFLALSIDSDAAIRNLRHMGRDGWIGPFGFYESIDYSSDLRAPVMTREWMAHHQGMSLLAILNLLRDQTVQRWFHENPVIQSVELLLHEIPISKARLKAQISELDSIRLE